MLGDGDSFDGVLWVKSVDEVKDNIGWRTPEGTGCTIPNEIGLANLTPPLVDVNTN